MPPPEPRPLAQRPSGAGRGVGARLAHSGAGRDYQAAGPEVERVRTATGAALPHNLTKRCALARADLGCAGSPGGADRPTDYGPSRSIVQVPADDRS